MPWGCEHFFFEMETLVEWVSNRKFCVSVPAAGNKGIGCDYTGMNTSFPAAMFITWIITQKCFTGGQNDTVAIHSAAHNARLASSKAPVLMAFCLPSKFLFIPRLVAIYFFVVIVFFLASCSPVSLPLSMNLWLWEKALKEGLAGVNGGQLCQLLHPNEAALSFTKPQLITLQAISEQDCLSASHFSIPFSPQSTT